MATDRERRLTEAGTEMYLEKCVKFARELNRCHKDIQSIISTIQENPNGQDINNFYDQLKYVCQEFERISDNYIDFLSRTRTAESEDEKSTHLKFRDHLMRVATNILEQIGRAHV